MHDTKEYAIAPKLAHHLIGISFAGAIAAACAYIAITNTEGLVTRRTNLSADTLNVIVWVVCAAACLLSVVLIVELIATKRRAVPTMRFTPSEFSIPMVAAFKKQIVTASYAQITQVQIVLSAPNRVLRIHTTEGTATVAELNVGTAVFDEVHAMLVQRAARNQDPIRAPSVS